MEIYNKWWLVPVCILLILAVPYWGMMILAFIGRNVPKWFKTYREKEAQNWHLPESIRKWVNSLFLLFFGYMSGLIAVMVALITMPLGKKESIGSVIFTEGAMSDDAALALVVVLAPIGVLLIPILVALYAELIVSIKHQWRDAESRRERLTVVGGLAILGVFGIACIISIFQS